MISIFRRALPCSSVKNKANDARRTALLFKVACEHRLSAFVDRTLIIRLVSFCINNESNHLIQIANDSHKHCLPTWFKLQLLSAISNRPDRTLSSETVLGSNALENTLAAIVWPEPFDRHSSPVNDNRFLHFSIFAVGKPNGPTYLWSSKVKIAIVEIVEIRPKCDYKFNKLFLFRHSFTKENFIE